MRYLLLIYGNDQDWSQRSRDEVEQILNGHRAFSDDLRRTNAYVAAEALQPTATATTIRLQDGEPFLTDGPYIEAKEQVAGFYLIDAENLDRALELAKRLTMADGGPVEVRPVMDT